MADQSQQLKAIAANVEALYQHMRRAASNIAGLLQVGAATCDEVKAYNLWALACYNTQRGMLATLRANGEAGVPELPPAPTLFAWRGVQGANAWNIDCSTESSLSGAMTRALRGPTAKSQFLSTNEIVIITQDQSAYDPQAAPSFAALAAQSTGLGVAAAVVIIIASIAVTVTVAIAAIMQYLETSDIQESNTKQVALQAEAYAAYTATRLSCYSSCTAQGKSTSDCVDVCKNVVDKPSFTLPGQGEPWGWLQWTGFTVVAGVGAMVAYKAFARHQVGKPILELP